jgi:MFS family permease
MRRLFGIRDARIFLLGWGLSMFGDTAMFLVLGIWAKELTGSNAAAGLIFFVIVVPQLFSPFAGLFVDRLRKRPLLIVVNTLAGLSVLLLLFVHGRDDVWLLYVVAALYGVGNVILYSARSAFLVIMLPRDLLADANAAFMTVREGLRLISPLVGAGLYAATSGAVVAVLDAATYGAVVAALLLVRTPEERPEREESNFLTELAAGVRHIIATLPLKQIIFTTGACILFVGFSETLVFAVIEFGLERSPAFLGVLEALQGAGAIAGGLTATRALRRFGDVRLVGIGMLLFALGDVTFAASSLLLVAPGIFLAGFAIAWFIVGYATAIQVRTPRRLQGRVASAAGTIISTPQTIGIALGAGLISVLDYRALVALMAIGVAACGAYLLTRGPEPVVAEEPATAPVA